MLPVVIDKHKLTIKFLNVKENIDTHQFMSFVDLIFAFFASNVDLTATKTVDKIRYKPAANVI